MPLYIYLKKEPQSQILKKRQEVVLKVKYRLGNFIASKVFSTIFSGIFVILGLSMLSFAGIPMINWQLSYRQSFPESKIIRPIPLNLIVTNPKGEVLAGEENKDLFYASNWFSGFSPQKPPSAIKEYTLSIPKLKIFNAQVLVGAEELKKSLVHYGGTAIPGEYGNSVIFGHSCLPQFYNPKNYECIFGTLDALKPGDEINVFVDNVEYKYIVYELKTVMPDDIWILEQKFDNYYLSLVTCVPPGLDWKRLVVKAKLERI